MLQDKALVSELHVSRWTCHKFDKAISLEVTSSKGADSDAGRWNKRLVSKARTKKIDTIYTKSYLFHIENTLPWKDDGGRILPIGNFDTYTSTMRQFQDDFNVAVPELINQYQNILAEEQIRQNGMFKLSDYPKQSDLYGKYAFKVRCYPIPSENDFRISLADSEINRMKSELIEEMQTIETQAIKDLYSRLHTVVERMVVSLSDPDKVFHKSMLENIKDLARLIPKLNVSDDTILNDLAIEADRLTINDPDTLREDKVTRADTASQAKELLDTLSQYV